MVIQRWQSVFLLIAAIFMACFSFASLGQLDFAEYSLKFTTLGFELDGNLNPESDPYYQHTWIFFTVSILSCVIPFINIFLFKNLNLQKRLCIFEILFLIALLTICFTYVPCRLDNTCDVTWSWIISAPFISIISTVIAYIRIRADQRLLQSVDRLR